MKLEVDSERLQKAYESVQELLLNERNSAGHWVGELSTSPLSTATAIMALHQVRLQRPEQIPELSPLIENGLAWLARHQNSDGGWGDTLKSRSNISTTMLSHAVFHTLKSEGDFSETIFSAATYIDDVGGVEAVVKRYGKDKTFSVPILTHCALAGLVDWKQVSALPFELSCLSHRFYATIRLPVVSYALPALIAIGQVRHHFRKPWNPLLGWLRDSCISRSLKKLKRIQPETGGFLEATPLTSFVTMSLAAKGLADHPVVVKGVEFIKSSVLEDGSWPIDTNLATWVTTLAVNALGDDLPNEDRPAILEWLLSQQYTEVHAFTNAAPGGWAWTDLSGGVPDGDDTPGAMLAILQLQDDGSDNLKIRTAIQRAARWLLDLQNRDGGWPTFCRGWGALPFDRSSADLTAHCLRALDAANPYCDFKEELEAARKSGFQFLNKAQQQDGSWLPLWFGNQHAPEDINPLYGTAKVVAAYRDTNRLEALPVQDGLRWLREAQNEDGGWGGIPGVPSTVEESSLAIDALLANEDAFPEVSRGISWLIDRVEAGTVGETAPIGFYFAKLWYFERLYPIIFAASALRKTIETIEKNKSSKDAGAV